MMESCSPLRSYTLEPFGDARGTLNSFTTVLRSGFFISRFHNSRYSLGVFATPHFYIKLWMPFINVVFRLPPLRLRA
jgi:hypothetical protein